MLNVQVKRTFIEVVSACDDGSPSPRLTRSPSAPATLMAAAAMACAKDIVASARRRSVTLSASHSDARPSDTVSGGAGPSVTKNDTEAMTTVVLRNIPIPYTRTMLLDLMDSEGFFACYDFVYLPIKFRKNISFGYAFINLINEVEAQRFYQHFSGFSAWGMEDSKPAELEFSKDHQGYARQVYRYRNSALMHFSTPDEMRPMVLAKGVRVPFPSATEEIPEPKLRQRSKTECAPTMVEPRERAYTWAGNLVDMCPASSSTHRKMSWADLCEDDAESGEQTSDSFSVSTRTPSEDTSHVGNVVESLSPLRMGRRAKRTARRNKLTFTLECGGASIASASFVDA